MKKLIHRWRQKLFGRWEIDDPRPIAESAPYTYYLPSENELLALMPGDLAKICVRGIPAGYRFGVIILDVPSART